MRQLTLRSICILAATLVLLGGCSYRPLYGTGQDGSNVQSVLAGIAVDEQNSRAGQLVRNDLLSTMGSTPDATTLYQLKLEPVEKTSLVSALPDQKLQRYRLNVKFALVNVASGKVVSEGASFSTVSFDTVQQPIADLQAAGNARDRATREVAEDIRLRLAAFVSAANG